MPCSAYDGSSTIIDVPSSPIDDGHFSKDGADIILNEKPSFPSQDIPNTSSHSHSTDFSLFGIPLTGCSLSSTVGIYTVGIFVTYIAVFIIQESVFKYSEFEFGGLLTFFQFAFFSIMGLVHHYWNAEKGTGLSLPRSQAPMRFYFMLGLYSVIGTAASSYSLQLLNFPTWVLFKSSRVISVMIGGIFLLGKRYSFKEYFGVFLLAVGLIVFTLGDITLLPSFNPVGVLLVFLSLLMNSFEGNMQERGMSEYKMSENEMLLFGYGFGALQILPWILFNGEFFAGIEFCRNNTDVLLQVGANCLLSYVGILLVLGLVKISSALTAVIVTSSRKALTVVFSFILFAKPFSVFYPLGFLVFFTGIALNVYAKNAEGIKTIVSTIKSRLWKQHSQYSSTSIKNV
eukprot:TRINITY_DN2648_c0_g1_i1.p1 TRINITY_DN2648_c0_g1~~TRINITY_DN2648_c0_g1_i1.p1  ORF type:complete len:441 (+),score=76.09 TRINITY_DN2648_c0_g1_i1:126-1325(+)